MNRCSPRMVARFISEPEKNGAAAVRVRPQKHGGSALVGPLVLLIVRRGQSARIENALLVLA